MGRREEDAGAPREHREHRSHKPHKSHRREHKHDRYDKSDRPEKDLRDRDANKHGGQQGGGEASPDRQREEAAPAQPFDKPLGNEVGGENSMSVDETNRVRISLGLKPLSMDGGKAAKAKEQAAQRAKQAAEAERAQKAELPGRLAKKKEMRRQQELLQSTKKLGEEEEGGDDVAGWVERSRLQQEADKHAALAQAVAAARPARRQGSDDDSEDDAHDGPAAMEGLRIRHKAEDLEDGDAVIMTLADRNILDERGELDEDEDILEENLLAERKKREKARKAATKVGQPLFEEDGKRRSILDKYDEEEEEAGLQIGFGGAVGGDDVAQRQAEIRSRLAGSQDAGAPGAGPTAGSDFYTAEEMSAMLKPKKKKLKKKLRQKPQAVTAGDIEMLEAEAEAAGAVGDDHGSRVSRAARQEEVAKKLADAEKARMDRYERAVAAGNEATVAMSRAPAAVEAAEPDEEEDDLAESLARARRAAAERKEAAGAADGATAVAEEVAKRREEEESAQAANLLNNDAVFTEASEFARSIQLGGADDDGRGGRVKAEAPDMADDEEETHAASGMVPETAEPGVANYGSWVSADKPGGSEADAADGAAEVKEEEAGEPAMTRERPIHKGLGGALNYLKERGELAHKVEWSGRTNDMKGEKLLGLDQVYEGANQQDRVARQVELALTRRDRLGNVLTPKQGFRELCYRFHGKPPSKNKMEKALRKDAEAIAAKRSATSEKDTQSLAQQKAESKRSATPYMVLTGKVKPGQTADPKSSYATADPQVALTPMLGGGHTPLAGRQKVEVMLGMKRPGGSMAPPPALRKRQ
ncbi:hypothetical protein WJX74_001624 [Apatococcus lobatus]|uniref:Uncharacterized protein n=1 Tax=Apatococcus lobatus TaxID=904363 RepID=A0AAW1SA95_9CHLO